MSEILKTAEKVANDLVDSNESGRRVKRYAKYYLFHLNQYENMQIKRDFTTKTENDLVILANKVNRDEFNYDIISVLCRWVTSLIVKTLLKHIIDTQDMICDSYNYFARDIKKIFNQARDTDALFHGKLNNQEIAIEKSVELLESINHAFEYYDYNRKYGCTMKYALENLYSNNPKVADIISDINATKHMASIDYFIDDQDNINVFDNYSNKIFKKLGMNNVNSLNYQKYAKKIKGHEDLRNKIVKIIIKYMEKELDDELNNKVEIFAKDGETANMITALIDATGITGYMKGYLKIEILKELKDATKSNYQELFKKIHEGKSNDYLRLKMLYEQLQDIEETIIINYRDMNEGNSDVQIEVNGWLGEVEEQNWNYSMPTANYTSGGGGGGSYGGGGSAGGR